MTGEAAKCIPALTIFVGLLHSLSEEFADEAVEEGVQQLGKLRLVAGLREVQVTPTSVTTESQLVQPPTCKQLSYEL